jgi:hypothetical protein
LPDAGRAEHGEHARPPFGERALERIAKSVELRRPPDHRRVEPPSPRLLHAQHAVGVLRFLLAPYRERLQRLDDDGVAHELEGRLADHDLA